jgi:hypothetical protein
MPFVPLLDAKAEFQEKETAEKAAEFETAFDRPQDIDYIDDANTQDTPPLELPYNYTPRWYQTALWGAMFPDRFPQYANGLKTAVRRAVLNWHRRSGKDKTVVNIVMCKAYERPGLYLYMLPTAEQARIVIWQGQSKDGVKFTDHFPEELIVRTHDQRMEIEIRTQYEGKTSLIKLTGADNFDRKMGVNAIGVVFSEFSLQNPVAWDYFRPILAENEGWAIFPYTPRGRNHGYDMMQVAKKLSLRTDSQWFYSLLPNSVTKAIPPKAIEDERDAGMSDDMIAQEFECSFDAMAPGVIFARQVALAYEDGRVRENIAPAKAGQVHTFWDIGMRDETWIWFVQAAGGMITFVHGYGNTGQGMDHYIKYVRDWIVKRSLMEGDHWGPHDLKVREWGGKGKSRQRAAWTDHQFKFKVGAQWALEDQIEAGRSMFSRCLFSESTCGHGVPALASWGYQWDPVKKVMSAEPVHDWSSHAASAYMLLAMAWKEKYFKGKNAKAPAWAQADVAFDPYAA